MLLRFVLTVVTAAEDVAPIVLRLSTAGFLFEDSTGINSAAGVVAGTAEAVVATLLRLALARMSGAATFPIPPKRSSKKLLPLPAPLSLLLPNKVAARLFRPVIPSSRKLEEAAGGGGGRATNDIRVVTSPFWLETLLRLLTGCFDDGNEPASVLRLALLLVDRAEAFIATAL